MTSYFWEIMRRESKERHDGTFPGFLLLPSRLRVGTCAPFRCCCLPEATTLRCCYYEYATYYATTAEGKRFKAAMKSNKRRCQCCIEYSLASSTCKESSSSQLSALIILAYSHTSEFLWCLV